MKAEILYFQENKRERNMSYILDALKKAEKERKRGVVPNLSTIQDPIPHKKKKRHLWAFILVIALFINAGILLFWLRPWETKETINVAKSASIATEESSIKVTSDKPLDIQSNNTMKSIHPKKPEVVVPEENISLDSKTKLVLPNPLYRKQKDQIAQSQTEQMEETSPFINRKEQPDTSLSTSKKPQKAFISEEPRHSTQTNSLSKNKIYSFKNLPSSIKEIIPTIHISVFIYSDDPSARIVKINGKSVREGQDLDEGLKVEKIVPDGVIFNYEDYRFHVGIK